MEFETIKKIFLWTSGIVLTTSFIWRTFSKINFTKLYILHLIITSILILYVNYLITKKFIKYQERKKEERIRINNEKELIESFLENELNYNQSGQITEFLDIIEKTRFHPKSIKPYKTKLKEIIIQVKRLYEKLKHKEELEKIKKEKEEAQKAVDDLIYLKKSNSLDKEERQGVIKEELNIEENNVFLKKEVSEEEIEILLDYGYKQTNEYCVEKNKNITVLVKPILNHSKTHIFLSWSVTNLLYTLGIDEIKEHKTKDADITFKYKNKIYALEIETGNLLKKKKQLKEKVNYLNKKYKNRWVFIVSNKNLVSKYKKHGLTTQRKQVAKNIKKMLKIDTQDF